jgi:GT2 family glycosyltransferase
MENKTIPKFTFCITSKNNLRYLKYAISYIKENSSRYHDIFVFIDSDNDGTEDWCIDNNITYIKNASNELFGIGNAYNLLVKRSKTDFVVIYHADMIMGKGFDLALYKNWKPKTVVSATRIEPPLHPSDPSKITYNFGLWPETDIADGFKVTEFNEFVEKNKKDETTSGIFAPWLIHRDDFLEVNGHDPIMKSHSEDRDLFNRFLLNGYNLIQSWEAFVYHLTCRGGQFEHASQSHELTYKSDVWNKLALTQTKEFIRKWGNVPRYDIYQYPIIPKKYNTTFIVHDCNLQGLETLEPWCDRIYINNDNVINEYINLESKNTSFDLTKRVLNINKNESYSENDIIVEFNIQHFNQNSFNIIQNLSDIITESGDIGQFELDCFKITIHQIKDYSNELICI